MCEWLCGSEWCDVRLQCGGRALPAHRAVLASVSSFLRHILLSNLTEETPTLIVLPEFDLEAMSSVLYYIYNGEVIIQKHKLERFMEIVKAMQIFVDDRYLPSACKSVEDSTSSAGINGKIMVKCKEFRLGDGPFVTLKKRPNIGNAYPKNVKDPHDNDKQIRCGRSNETCFRNEQLSFEDRQRSFVRDLFMETYPQNGNANGREVAPGVLAMPSALYRPPPSDPLSNANGKHLHNNTHVQMMNNPNDTPGFINYPGNLHCVQIPLDAVGNANSIGYLQIAHFKNFIPPLADSLDNRNFGKTYLNNQWLNMVLKRQHSLNIGFHNHSERHPAAFLNCNKYPFCHNLIHSNEQQSNKTANSLSTPSTSTSPKGAILNQVLDSPWCPRQPTNYRPFRRKVQDLTDIPSADGKEKAFNDDNNNIQTSSTPAEVDELSANTIETAYIAPSLQIGTDFKCTVCDQVFTDSDALAAHSRRHSTAAKYSCTECSKSFSQLRNFKYHMSIHRGTKEFAATCSVCGKYFNDRGYLSSHMKIHRNRKEYKCSQCPKSFNQRVAYNMHVRIHTGVKPHVCGECGKAFSRKMLLKQHQRTHSGERPYACPHCDKRFADRSNMTLHLRLHSGIKPFSCTLCPKSFTKKHHLKSHLNFHTGAKPYSCPKCKLAFTQSSNMRTHLKKCTAPDPSEIAESLVTS